MSRRPPTQAEISQVLGRYPSLGPARAEAYGSGLINHTFRLETPGAAYALQRVNPIFDPAIHHNIEAVTRRLAAAGLTTPLLVANDQGGLWTDLAGAGLWRVMTWVEGVSHEVVETLEQATEAGRLVGLFHAALGGLEAALSSTRPWVHDTRQHLRTLKAAFAGGRGHRLYEAVAPMIHAILDSARQLKPLPPLPPCLCHGDLKLNNILFSARGEKPRALCLIDLDTVGPMHLAHELGDAWRSWCCRGGEEAMPADFDLEIFSASLSGYQEGRGRPLGQAEKRALLGGVEWVSLELAARFAADVLNESYFGWDEKRFATAGEHNLARARGQWSLHCLVMRNRPARAEILGTGASVIP